MSYVKTIIIGAVKIQVAPVGEGVDLLISNLSDDSPVIRLKMTKPQSNMLGVILKLLAM